MTELLDKLIPKLSPEAAALLAFAEQARASAETDKRGGNREEFMAVQRAYEVLSDPERRAKYDETGSDRSEPNLRDKVLEHLARLSLQVAETVPDPETTDLVEVMRQAVRNKIDEVGMEIVKAKAKADKLERLASRFKVASNQVNIARRTLERQAEDLRNNVALMRQQVEFSELLLKELEHFSYEADPKPERNPWGYFTFTQV